MELKEYLDILYNRKWFVIVTLAVILFFALTVSFLQAPTYQSSVKILANMESGSSTSVLSDLLSTTSDIDRFIQDQVEIIKTDALAKAVQKQLEYRREQAAREKGSSDKNSALYDIPSAAGLQGMVSVQTIPDSNIFKIVVDGGDEFLTRDVAQTYADEYIENRDLAAVSEISEARKEVWDRLSEVEDQIERLANEAKQYAVADLPAEIAASIDQNSTLWGTLYNQYISLRVSEALSQGSLEVIETAAAGDQTGPKTARNGVLALFLGLMLGVGIAFFVDYMDATLHTREDFAQNYDLNIIGEVPAISTEGLAEYAIPYFELSKLPAVEGYRTIRTNLQYLNIDAAGGIILFTSALPDEGKTTITVNLAAALSEMGKRVLIVDADLRKPTVSKYFDLESKTGLTGVLSGATAVEQAIFATDHRNLFVMPSGIKPPNPGEMLASARMRETVESLSGAYDYLFLDSPPVRAANDAIAMCAVVDGVILVGRYGVAERESAQLCVEQLRNVNANILGLVVNGLEAAKRYGYYHYQYYYNPDDMPLGRFAAWRGSKKGGSSSKGK